MQIIFDSETHAYEITRRLSFMHWYRISCAVAFLRWFHPQQYHIIHGRTLLLLDLIINNFSFDILPQLIATGGQGFVAFPPFRGSSQHLHRLYRLFTQHETIFSSAALVFRCSKFVVLSLYRAQPRVNKTLRLFGNFVVVLAKRRKRKMEKKT